MGGYCDALFISAIIAIASCSENYTDYYPEYTCWNDMDACGRQHLEKYGINGFEDMQGLLANRTGLTQLTEDIHNTADCADEVAQSPECDKFEDISIVVSQMRLVAGYLESPGAIDNLVDLSSSQCLTNTTLHSELEEEASMCVMPVGIVVHTGGNFCEALSEAVECLQTSVGATCGAAASEFVGRVWDYVMLPQNQDAFFANMDVGEDVLSTCEQQIVALRRAARAAKPYLERLRK